MRGTGGKERIRRCHAPVSRIILFFMPSLGRVILMMGKGWLSRDYQTALTQEYIFTADTAAHEPSTELTEGGSPR